MGQHVLNIDDLIKSNFELNIEIKHEYYNPLDLFRLKLKHKGFLNGKLHLPKITINFSLTYLLSLEPKIVQKINNAINEYEPQWESLIVYVYDRESNSQIKLGEPEWNNLINWIDNLNIVDLDYQEIYCNVDLYSAIKQQLIHMGRAWDEKQIM